MQNNFEAYYYGDEDEEPIRVKQREKSEKAPKIMFARWGGMNPTRKKDLEKNAFKSEENGNPIISFHYPPEHRGIYAFIWPYIEPFLAAWNKEYRYKTGKKDEHGEDEERMKPIKKFQHHGDIWCHFVQEAKEQGVGKEYKKSWVKVDTKDLPMLLGKVMAKDIKQLKQPSWWTDNKGYKGIVKDPYKRGRVGGGLSKMEKDHLEVFIPGKVRETKSE